ncbi:transcriptional repressor CTCF [Drosophila navojoa]|nr:transcriptional repressor CTCF [Drosophila navojoa]XP_017956561.1 transcriptional repressor CTCF [Drosophila navojoa]
MSKGTRNSDSGDLQTYLRNFHKEIEDGSVDDKEVKADDDTEVEQQEENQDDDDDDKYFIDDEGNCYIKTTPRKQEQLKKKLKQQATSKASDKEDVSIPIRSTTRAASSKTSKEISLRPAKPKPVASAQGSPKAINIRPAPPKRTPVKMTTSTPVNTPRGYLRSSTRSAKSVPESPPKTKIVIEKVMEFEELVDDPSGGDVTIDQSELTATANDTSLTEDLNTTKDDSDKEVYEFDENAANITAKSDVDFVPSGNQFKLKPASATSASQKFACSHCSYTTNKKFLISRHVRTHNSEMSFKCSICERGFKSNMGLVNHLNTHMGNKPHKCKLCESAFTTNGELIRHTRYKHTKEKPHKCTECSYASVELTKLRRHMTCHTGERPYQCPHCTYASQDMFKLKRHLVIHTGEKKYQCDICKSRFTQSNSLKAHKLIHSVVDKPVFQCTLCPTTCGRKADLRTHMANMHTSDKRHTCKRCGQELPDRYQYKLHIKSHEGEKCYRCTLCSYASVSQRHLDSHMLIHTDSKPFKCDFCSQAFRQRQLLRRHINLMHNEDYKPPEPRVKVHSCPSCMRVFTHKGNLMRHMESHDDSLNAQEQKLKLRLGRNVRLQPDGSIVTLDGDDVQEFDKSDTISIDIEEQFEITEFEEIDEEESVPSEPIEETLTAPTIRTRRDNKTVAVRDRAQSSSNKPIIINRQLKAPRAHRERTTQAGTFRIKKEPDANEFTVELEGEDEQFMVVQLVNDDSEVVVKREPKINADNCFGFEDDANVEYEEYVEPVAEVDATSQQFLQLMDMIEQDT